MMICGLRKCPCVKTACVRIGDCVACQANHDRKPDNPLVWCLRPVNLAEVERLKKEEEQSFGGHHDS